MVKNYMIRLAHFDFAAPVAHQKSIAQFDGSTQFALKAQEHNPTHVHIDFWKPAGTGHAKS